MSQLYTSAASAEARFGRVETDIADRAFTLIRFWPAIHAASADTVILDLANDTYVTNPVADGQTYSGKYANSSLKPHPDAGDVGTGERGITVEQQLIRIRPVTSDTSLIFPLVQRTRDVLHPFGEGRGTKDGLIYRYRNLDPASDTKCMAIADTTLEVKKGGSSAWDLVSRKTTREENNTMTFWMLFNQVDRIDWDSNSIANPHYLERGPVDTAWEFRRKFWFGINRSNYATTVADLRNFSKADTGFVVESYDVRDVEDGAKDYVQTLKRANRSGWKYVTEWQAGLGNYLPQVVRIYPNVKDTKADVLCAATGEARTDFAVDGTTYYQLRTKRERFPDKTSTVTQIGHIPGDLGYGGLWGSETDTRYYYRYIRNYKGKRIRRLKIGRKEKQEDQMSHCVVWLNAFGLHLITARWDFVGAGRFLAVAEWIDSENTDTSVIKLNRDP